MRHNMRGRVSENTNVSAWITGNLDYELGYYSSLEFGSGILYHDGIDAKVYLDELYAMYTGEWLVVIAGQMQKAELYNGLSSSNENILWSLNAPPPSPAYRYGLKILYFHLPTRPLDLNFPGTNIF